jgi:hypothetical protein
LGWLTKVVRDEYDRMAGSAQQEFITSAEAVRRLGLLLEQHQR